jgi:hypothetical protein
VEEKRRDEEEKRLRARDKRRMKKLTAMNLPLAVAATSALNDPLLVGPQCLLVPGRVLRCWAPACASHSYLNTVLQFSPSTVSCVHQSVALLW